MNTTGIQNYLSNVFRPFVVYDTGTSNFVPKLDMSNIDNYSGNTITVAKASVGDSAFNVYVGDQAGSLVYNLPNGASNVTAVGYGAGSNISNVSNSEYFGFRAGAGASNANDVIAIGANVTGNGNSNIFIGSSTGTTGDSNIFLGHNIILSNVSNQIRIGLGTKIPIAADLSNNWVGIGGITTPIVPNGTTMDVSGITRSTGGFASARGSTVVSNASNVSIGTLKNGLVMIAVASGTTHFDGRTSFVLDSAAPTVSNLSSNKSATTTVNFTASNINISNTTGGDLTYAWTITYFPLP